jgi:hypothetical protein
LREAVLSIRKLGYATTDQELEIGLRSIDGLRRRRCGGDERERLVGASFARADGQKLLRVLKANAVGLGRLVSSAAGRREQRVRRKGHWPRVSRAAHPAIARYPRHKLLVGRRST